MHVSAGVGVKREAPSLARPRRVRGSTARQPAACGIAQLYLFDRRETDTRSLIGSTCSRSNNQLAQPEIAGLDCRVPRVAWHLATTSSCSNDPPTASLSTRT